MKNNISNPMPLGTITTSVKRGLSSSYLKDGDTEVHVIKAKDITEQGFLNIDTVDIHPVKKTPALTKAQLNKNDILITLKGSSFKIALVPENAEGFVVSANIIGMTIGNQIRPEIVAWYLKSPHGMHQLQKCAAGSALLSLNTNLLLEINIPVPSHEKQEVISSYLKDLADYNTIIEREEEIISKISAAVLDALMTGE